MHTFLRVSFVEVSGAYFRAEMHNVALKVSLASKQFTLKTHKLKTTPHFYGTRLTCLAMLTGYQKLLPNLCE